MEKDGGFISADFMTKSKALYIIRTMWYCLRISLQIRAIEIFTLQCQLGGIQTPLGDTHLDVSVMTFAERFNWVKVVLDLCLIIP